MRSIDHLPFNGERTKALAGMRPIKGGEKECASTGTLGARVMNQFETLVPACATMRKKLHIGVPLPGLPLHWAFDQYSTR